jgi:hypothetical protein
MIQVKGAGRLLVRFDSKSVFCACEMLRVCGLMVCVCRCRTNDDLLTRLAFYRDAELLFHIVSYKARRVCMRVDV